ncbi:peptidase C45, acyl-coenzyme A:6-aminopenicillanic acid acyl-transferase [[Actinomadura] parvosata subsp. kistnae]|uniref:Peptidase C45 n=1 Tax=[Actinomadura] parvosata subsp. kistnae TaxID=1909395 RepID=A0A1V0A567_9ACTN|nr:C45 family peptidase [Nonomuraea sp. ATCC 55076]AQZ65353.1 peptidase C45 [Nonomuraea sp. ATCC 55076]SPL96676.1 peptidase C45, acyl-coenzyme A:6-aminopenicillanic acid acyl-transferase [Actinomadura parvosata subsp. kistnae]
MSFPTFTSSQTDPRARGKEFGTHLRGRIAANLAGYTDLFAVAGAGAGQVRAWGERALEAIGDWAPAQAEEIAGIAAGAGLEPWQVAVINARTEILAAIDMVGHGECSTSVVLPPDGPPRTVQTWDWHDHLRDAPVLWEYELDSGRVVRTFTEAGTLAKIGVTDAGLGVHFNILRHDSDTADLGVPVHLIARRILDEAATVEEATGIARSARVSASTVITVVTEHQAASIEISPAGVAAIPPGPDGVLLHCNHFLDAGLAAGERHATERPGTYDRFRHLEAHVEGLSGADQNARALAMLSHAPEGAPVCAHPDLTQPLNQRWETLATIGLDLPAGRLRVHQGGPCQVTEATWQTF